MTKTNGVAGTVARLFFTVALLLGASTIALAQSGQGTRQDKDDHGAKAEKVLYIWAQDQAQVAPDFLAVIDFDEQSANFGEVIIFLRLPLPANIGNELHHVLLNWTKTVLVGGDL